MRFALVNVGCKVNRVEIDDIAAHLLNDGAELVDDGSADIAIVNTCTVTSEAEKKTRKGIRHVLRANTHAQVLVTGCAVAIAPEEFAALDERVRIVAKPDVVRAAWECLGQRLPQNAGRDRAAVPADPSALRIGEGFRTRVGIKVQDGCNNACTYCIVHVARGQSASVPRESVFDEVAAYAAAGVRELVLSGINLGAYRDGDCDLTGLLRAAMPLIGEGRLRLSSIEPGDVDEGLIDLMASSDGRICRHLHLPLQSGSSKVLREMARPYDAEAFLSLVERLYAAMPQASLSTDVIVGFPGETEEDFQQTLRAIEAARFSKVHVFRYSRRAGTPAAQREDQVDAETAAHRVEQLSQVADALRLADARRRVGAVEQVLIERGGRGTTESYHPAILMDSRASEGSLVRAPLTELSADGMFLI